MREEMRKVYVSEEDNKSFDTKEECQTHIDELNKNKERIKNMKFYAVNHTPDLTEGRGYYGLTFIAIETKYNHENWLLDYCFTHFGNAIQMIQGCSPTNGWSFREITFDDYTSWEHRSARVGDYSYSAKAHFISNVDNFEDFPNAEGFNCCFSIDKLV
jgi:hypothetical protein